MDFIEAQKKVLAQFNRLLTGKGKCKDGHHCAYAERVDHGAYYLPDIFGFGESTMGMVVNRLSLTPFVSPFTLTADRLLIAWNSPVAANVIAGIYPDSGTLVPDGTSPLRTVASVAKNGTWRMQELTMVEGNIQLVANTIYWLANISDDTSNVNRHNNWNRYGTLQGLTAALGAFALPDPCPVTTAGNNTPSMGVRVASIP